MVERVAKVICAAEEHDATVQDYLWGEFRPHARAVLRALRERTDSMKYCSDEIHWDTSCGMCGGLKDGWTRMIDEALKE